MSEGIILLLVIALFFLAMYIYAYGSTYYTAYKEERDRKRKIKNIALRDEKLQQDILKKKEVRDEKDHAAKSRSEEIKRELEWLEELKRERLSKQNQD